MGNHAFFEIAPSYGAGLTGKEGKNPRLTNPPPLFIIFLKAMTERDGDAAPQRAGGRCEPAGMVLRSYGS